MGDAHDFNLAGVKNTPLHVGRGGGPLSATRVVTLCLPIGVVVLHLQQPALPKSAPSFLIISLPLSLAPSLPRSLPPSLPPSLSLSAAGRLLFPTSSFPTFPLPPYGMVYMLEIQYGVYIRRDRRES